MTVLLLLSVIELKETVRPLTKTKKSIQQLKTNKKNYEKLEGTVNYLNFVECIFDAAKQSEGS